MRNLITTITNIVITATIVTLDLLTFGLLTSKIKVDIAPEIKVNKRIGLARDLANSGLDTSNLQVAYTQFRRGV